MDDDRLYIAVVLEGEGLYPPVQRASLPALLGGARRSTFPVVEDASSWVLRHVGDAKRAAELAQFVARLRAPG